MEVSITDEALDEIIRLPASIQTRMHKIVTRLGSWPDVSGVKPLRGNLAGHYRIRTGDYRLQFYLSADRIIVEKVGHRDGFYED
jgi:mRNA-degrading endonuclease RelE of RelBE toxin-antitoxin system